MNKETDNILEPVITLPVEKNNDSIKVLKAGAYVVGSGTLAINIMNILVFEGIINESISDSWLVLLTAGINVLAFALEKFGFKLISNE